MAGMKVAHTYMGAGVLLPPLLSVRLCPPLPPASVCLPPSAHASPFPCAQCPRLALGLSQRRRFTLSWSVCLSVCLAD